MALGWSRVLQLTNKHMKVLLSLSPMLCQELENATRCLFLVTILFPENLDKCSLNFGNG
jgi:hypothetical protein